MHAHFLRYTEYDVIYRVLKKTTPKYYPMFGNDD